MKRKITAFLLLFCLMLSACKGDKNKDVAPETESATENTADQKEFDELLWDIFAETVSVNALTFNAFVDDPEAMGLPLPEMTLGSLSDEVNAEYLRMTEDQLERLLAFDRDSLSTSQQLDYDIMKERLELDIESYGYDYYSELLGPEAGIPANLTTNLFDYRIKTKDDLENYFTLLSDMRRYFGEIIEYEKTRSSLGYFMNDGLVDSAIQKYRDFISDPENNAYISFFEDHIRTSLPDLTEDEIKSYVERNKEIVNTVVIPAYEDVIACLEELKGTGKNDSGLCNLPKGKDYYKYIVKEYTSTGMDPEELYDYLEDKLSTLQSEIYSMLTEDPSLYNYFYDLEIDIDDPEELLDHFHEKTDQQFPKLLDTTYRLKYMDESLQDTNTMAYYIIPPVDAYDDNVIYINPAYNTSLSENMTTFSHEGYPGHLYQITYYMATDPQPIRAVESFIGYTEGWAVSVQDEAYGWFDDIDPKVVDLMRCNTLYNYAVVSLADLGVNLYGWTLEDMQENLAVYGMPADGVDGIFDYVVESPGSFFSYGVGGLQWVDIKDMAMEALGDDFDEKDFYAYVLSKGPCSFDTLETIVETYVETKGAKIKDAA